MYVLNVYSILEWFCGHVQLLQRKAQRKVTSDVNHAYKEEYQIGHKGIFIIFGHSLLENDH
jgi:hypothetical protein